MLNSNRNQVVLHFAGHEVHLLSSGASYWPQKKLLVVADLHLEKGSYFASRGQPLPLTDTRATLDKLRQDLFQLQPEMLLCLGDNVHDASGFLRMKEDDLLELHSLRHSVRDWLWIIGNHDTNKLVKPPLEHMHFVSDLTLGNLYFSHEFQKGKSAQVIGHYHPKVSFKKQGIRITGKCFALTKNLLIMPSLGSFTGGLDINHKVYEAILTGDKKYYLIFQNDIFLVK